MLKISLTILALVCISMPLFSQHHSELGFPQIKNYSPKEYGAQSQNWAIIQDKRGMMYFGNVGVLQYDGYDWRLIPLPNNGTVRSFGITEDGVLYVGGVGDLGYLVSDSNGAVHYKSLLEYVPAEYRDFADVWNLYVHGDYVYYSSNLYVFRWSINNKSIKVWKSSTNFHVSFMVNGDFYIREWQTGLLKLENDSLKFVPGSQIFADERIYVMLP